MTVDAMDLLNTMTLLEYYSNGTGALANNGMSVIGVMHTKQQSKGEKERPGEELNGQIFEE